MEAREGPAVLSSDIKAYRRMVTKQYGYYTLASAVLFIAAMGLYNYLAPRLSTKKRRPRSQNTGAGKLRKVSVPTWLTIAWGVLIVVCIFKSTSTDWTFLVKRMGRVTVALLPPTYFLTLRPSLLPSTFYLQLIPFHKWLSRFIVLLGAVHGIFYSVMLYNLGKIFKLKKLRNLSGIAALLGFVFMGVSSLKFFRMRYYRVFYGIHYALAWTCVGLVWYHSVPPSHEYILMCVGILLAQIFYRVYNSTELKLQVQYVSPTLLLVEIPREYLPKCLMHYKPGSHLRVSLPLSQLSTWFQSSHPYTIASLPHERSLKLVVRQTHFPVKLRQSYSIFGPFNSVPEQFLKFAREDQISRALFVVGGSGIAYAAPIMRYLRAYKVPIKLVWAIRDVRDMKVLNPLGLESSFRDGEIEIYLTSVQPNPRPRRSSMSAAFGEIESNDDDLEVSIESRYCDASDHPLLSQVLRDQFEIQDDEDFQPIIYNHRPVLNLRLKSWVCGVESHECCMTAEDDYTPGHTGAWVLSSGADRLVAETKRWARENDFMFCEEEFTL